MTRSLKKLTIIWLDDNLEFMRLIEPFFLKYNIDIIKCVSITEVTEHLKSKVSNNLLLDIRFPSHDKEGMFFLENLKNSYPHINVVVFTIYPNKIDEVKSINEFGALDYIIKEIPFDQKERDLLFNRIRRAFENKKPLPTVVILTAIQEECLAVKQHLGKIAPIKNHLEYSKGIFKLNGKVIANVIIREIGQGNPKASQFTENAIQNFKPDMILFVGIAGSRKPSDFSIGDVIFPEKIYYYERGKSEKDSFKARPEVAIPSYTLKELAKRERSEDHWKILIKTNYDKNIKADLGIIASGEQIVEHYYSNIGKKLLNHYNDTSAVDTESYGFVMTALERTSNILVGVVRGISDIIEQPNNNVDKEIIDRRPSNAKQLASDTAAAFAFWLILKTYE